MTAPRDTQHLWEKVNFALSYPFEAPPFDYLFFQDHALEIVAADDLDLGAWRVRLGARELAVVELLSGRDVRTGSFADLVPVVASGSNASPIQLNRKFYDLAPMVCVCLRARVPDFEVGFAAHIAPYGSIPASLRRCEGAVSEMTVNFLPERYVAEMHRTEALGRYYDLAEVPGLTVSRHGLEWCGDGSGYASVTGLVPDDQRAVPLSFARTSQWQAQAQVIRHLGEAISVQNFVRENILQLDRRLEREARLAALFAP